MHWHRLTQLQIEAFEFVWSQLLDMTTWDLSCRGVVAQTKWGLVSHLEIYLSVPSWLLNLQPRQFFSLHEWPPDSVIFGAQIRSYHSGFWTQASKRLLLFLVFDIQRLGLGHNLPMCSFWAEQSQHTDGLQDHVENCRVADCCVSQSTMLGKYFLFSRKFCLSLAWARKNWVLTTVAFASLRI